MIYSSVFVYLTKLLFSGTTVIQLPLKIRQIRKSKAVFTWTSSAVGIYFGLICITIPGEWSEKLLRLSHLIRRNTKITLDALARVLLRFSAAMCFLFGFSLVHLIACSFDDWPVWFCRWFSLYDIQAKIACTPVCPAFPSYLVPLFQNESSCKTFHIKMSLKWEWTDGTHFHMNRDSFWHRGTRQLRSGLLLKCFPTNNIISGNDTQRARLQQKQSLMNKKNI